MRSKLHHKDSECCHKRHRRMTKTNNWPFGLTTWFVDYLNVYAGGIVNNTLRPTIPNYCDLEWRTLMEQCWAPNPAARPSFTEIASRLRIMSSAASQTKSPGHKASKWLKQMHAGVVFVLSFAIIIGMEAFFFNMTIDGSLIGHPWKYLMNFVCQKSMADWSIVTHSKLH